MSSLRTIKATSRRLILETNGGTEKGRGWSTQRPPPGPPAPETPRPADSSAADPAHHTGAWGPVSAVGSGPGRQSRFSGRGGRSPSDLGGPETDFGRWTRPLEAPLDEDTKGLCPGTPPVSPGTGDRAVWMRARREALRGGVHDCPMPGTGGREDRITCSSHTTLFLRSSRDGKRIHTGC